MMLNDFFIYVFYSLFSHNKNIIEYFGCLFLTTHTLTHTHTHDQENTVFGTCEGTDKSSSKISKFVIILILLTATITIKGLVMEKKNINLYFFYLIHNPIPNMDLDFFRDLSLLTTSFEFEFFFFCLIKFFKNRAIRSERKSIHLSIE